MADKRQQRDGDVQSAPARACQRGPVIIVKRLLAAWRGRAIWTRLRRRYDTENGAYVVAFVEDDRPLNAIALRHIQDLIADRRARGVVVVTDQESVAGAAKETDGVLAVVRLASREIGSLLSFCEPTTWLQVTRAQLREDVPSCRFRVQDEVAPRAPTSSATNPVVLDLSNKQRLIPGTVVLAPYANTLSMCRTRHSGRGASSAMRRAPSDGVHELRSQRAADCGNQGRPLPSFPRGGFRGDGGLFVGVRSGSCDIVSGTTSRKVVLFDKDGRFYKGSAYEYFSLATMGLGRNVCELGFGGGDGEGLVNQAVEGLT